MMVSVFLSGMTAAMFLVASVFFLKFWKASRNRFFGLFAVALGLFAVERALSLGVFLAMKPDVYHSLEARGWIYLVRLAGFVVMFLSILDRNRTKIAQRKAARPKPSVIA